MIAISRAIEHLSIVPSEESTSVVSTGGAASQHIRVSDLEAVGAIGSSDAIYNPEIGAHAESESIMKPAPGFIINSP